MRPMTARPHRTVAVALAGAAVSLAACGGDGSSSAAGTGADSDAARIRLEKCLRDNGVELPAEPASGGGEAQAVRVDARKMRAAMQKCEKYRKAAFGTITPEQRQEFSDAFATFASCMRRHGVDLPDPPAEGAGGGAAPAPSGARRIDRSSPTVQAAEKACRDKLPRDARGGGPGFLVGPGPGAGT